MEKMIEAMYAAGVHVGYSRSRRHPSTTESIHAVKNRMDIIDLSQTATQLEAAIEFLKSVKASGKKILIVGTKPEVKRFVREATDASDMPYVVKRWIGGTLTNFKEIKGRVDMLKDLSQRQETGSLIYRTKKELLMLERKIEKLELNFGGLKDMEELPAAMIVIDSLKEDNAVQEARIKDIPIVAIANTDCDISIIDYPIVANDASQKSVGMIMEQIIESIKS